jgi:type II secretion system protein N
VITLTPRAKKILRWVGYGAFYGFCLVAFAFWTFPYERLKERITTEFNARQTGPKPMRLKMGDLSSYWLSGIEADNIELVVPPDPSKTDSSGSSSIDPGSTPSPDAAKPEKPKTMVIDTVHARVSLLRLLFGTVHVAFGADAFGGEVSGFTSDADKARKLELELEEVDLALAPMLGEMVGLPVFGKLDGTIDLLCPEQKLSKAEGKIELKLTDLAVGDGKAKIRDTIALPRVDAGTLEFVADATNGQLKIGKFSANGTDLELVAEGAIRLRDPFDSSIVSLNVRFKFNDKYKQKNETTKALFGQPGMPGLFDLDPKNQRAKRPDGFYGWRASGPISRLSFTPAATGGSAGGLGSGTPDRVTPSTPED